MAYEQMKEQLKLHLDEGIIKKIKIGYFSKSFIDNIDDVLENISENKIYLENKLGIEELNIRNLLEKFEIDSNITSNKIESFVSGYDKIKNESGPFSSYKKDKICKLIICFSLDKEKANILLDFCKILLKPLDNSHDAAFDFFINKWHYSKDIAQSIEEYEECVNFAKKYVSDEIANLSPNNIYVK